MKTSLKILIIAALALLGIEVAFSAGYIADAGFHKVRESFYSVYSHGFKVGEVKAVCEPLPVDNKKRFRFHSETTVQASFLFYSYNLAKTEEALVTDDGAYYYKRT
ncbi:MAG: hypothetical protein WCG31_11190, partial [Deltaproteobacteria bacterium]